MKGESAARGSVLLEAGQRFGSQPRLFGRLLAPAFRKPFDRIDAGLERGAIRCRLPEGSQRRLGGRRPGFEAEVHIRDWRALLRLATDGSTGWYQAWEAGEWTSPTRCRCSRRSWPTPSRSARSAAPRARGGFMFCWWELNDLICGADVA